MGDVIGHEIKKSYGVISENKSWRKELNLVAWNNKDAKFDLRSWTFDHDKCSKGVTLTYEEARELFGILKKIFGEEDR